MTGCSRRFLFFFSFLALLVFLPSVFHAQDRPKKSCFKCKSTGKIECPPPKIEKGAVHCSYYYKKDQKCGGVGFTMCDRCKDDGVEWEIDISKNDIEGWMEKEKEFHEVGGAKGVLVETDHVRVYLTIPRFASKRKRFDLHKGAHHFANLCEGVYADYFKLMGFEEEEKRKPKHTLILLDSNGTKDKFLRKYHGQGGANTGGLKLRGGRSWYITAQKGDQSGEQFEQNVVHNFSHLLIYKCMGTRGMPTWLDTGFAHYMEYLQYKANRNFCFVETPPEDKFQGGNSWRSKVKKESRGNVALAQFYNKDLNAYTHRDMALSYSYVDFLIAHDLVKFRDLVELVKGGTDSLEAVQKVYGWLPAELDENWKNYVRKRY